MGQRDGGALATVTKQDLPLIDNYLDLKRISRIASHPANVLDQYVMA